MKIKQTILKKTFIHSLRFPSTLTLHYETSLKKTINHNILRGRCFSPNRKGSCFKRWKNPSGPNPSSFEASGVQWYQLLACHPSWKVQSVRNLLVGGWTSHPSEKYARKIGSWNPKFRDENKTCLSCHHLDTDWLRFRDPHFMAYEHTNEHIGM